MKEGKAPVISIITLVVVLFGAIVYHNANLSLDSLLSGAFWVICSAVMFLGECLFKLIKKRYSANIGAFIVTAIMTVAFIVMFCLTHDKTYGVDLMFGQKRTGGEIVCLLLLPPMIVSLAVNIGNIIYKLTRRKADCPNDPQP